jgi:hypothetical protein
VGVVLDAGALVAIDRKDRRVGALLRVAQESHIPVRTSAGAVAQVWRTGARQPNLARALAGVDVAAINRRIGRQIGELLGHSHTADVVDGHVAVLTGAGDTLLTSDTADLRHLLATRKVRATVEKV